MNHLTNFESKYWKLVESQGIGSNIEFCQAALKLFNDELKAQETTVTHQHDWTPSEWAYHGIDNIDGNETVVSTSLRKKRVTAVLCTRCLETKKLKV